MLTCFHCFYHVIIITSFLYFNIGFEFSDVEPSALVQKQGGPCAVIAPVQAYILKILIMDTPGHCLKDVIINKPFLAGIRSSLSEI